MMRRACFAIATLAALAACSGDDAWFGGGEEPPLPGERVSVMLLERELIADPGLADLPISLPPPRQNDSWPQAGGLLPHAMHHLAASDQLSLAWRTSIGAGSAEGGQVLARPVVAEGRVYTVDAEGTIAAFDAASGAEVWRHEADDLDSEEG